MALYNFLATILENTSFCYGGVQYDVLSRKAVLISNVVDREFEPRSGKTRL